MCNVRLLQTFVADHDSVSFAKVTNRLSNVCLTGNLERVLLPVVKDEVLQLFVNLCTGKLISLAKVAFEDFLLSIILAHFLKTRSARCVATA